MTTDLNLTEKLKCITDLTNFAYGIFECFKKLSLEAQMGIIFSSLKENNAIPKDGALLIYEDGIGILRDVKKHLTLDEQEPDKPIIN